MNRPLTIVDLARRLGVSPTTVSDALNGRGRISPAMRERVRALADEVGYQPNAAARSLVRGRTSLLMLSLGPTTQDLLQFWHVDYFLRIMRAASARALQHQFALVLAPTHEPGLLQRIPFDGAIVVDPSDEHPLVRLSSRLGRPLVTLGRTSQPSATHVLDNDFPEATRTALEHAWSTGARRPALVCGRPDASYAVDIRDAFWAWCEQSGVEPVLVPVEGPLTQEGAAAALAPLLAGPHRPDAVLAATERLALGAEAAAENAGLRVPHDIRVIGFGDSHMAAAADPPLTMVELHPEELAERAVDALVTAVIATRDEEESQDAGTTYVPTSLVVRASSSA